VVSSAVAASACCAGETRGKAPSSRSGSATRRSNSALSGPKRHTSSSSATVAPEHLVGAGGARARPAPVKPGEASSCPRRLGAARHRRARRADRGPGTRGGLAAAGPAAERGRGEGEGDGGDRHGRGGAGRAGEGRLGPTDRGWRRGSLCRRVERGL
jgi:hypothetical protein